MRIGETIESITKKADHEALSDMQSFLQNEIDELSQKLMQQIHPKADRDWVQRELDAILELIRQMKEQLDSDEAMLSKKPLSSFACASCDGDLKKVRGVPAEYMDWNRLKGSESRISSVGPG
mmetsp:Transcript_4456/g.9052  ORF Transcript_4456/g.9052 Transcript_4456/m.9052 type:complete len:122 (-) Transcript_4456:201-566(-)|eukprot:CAMPEP_0116952240 /NCGR_PEP_ID=MMETSP0467-20121206/40614_1 /TAXON_ID=283647 /ORGANISM="Mesodinium pulex, Strain SPMC105" /LENGTH=121 /DNA_ID=CAMNT_0004637473 /DNA_START=218 /DNA_END=583 /DNA_ORIENTATION=-